MEDRRLSYVINVRFILPWNGSEYKINFLIKILKSVLFVMKFLLLDKQKENPILTTATAPLEATLTLNTYLTFNIY